MQGKVKERLDHRGHPRAFTALDFAVNSTPLSSVEGTPHVTALQSGAFLVTWQTSGSTYPGDAFDIRARIFNAAGTPVGVDFLVNTRTAGSQFNSDTVTLSDGGFLIVWADIAGGNIRGQRFDALGDRVDGDFIVSITSTSAAAGAPRNLAAAVLNDGRVAVTWTGPDGVGNGVFTAILDPRDGEVVGTPAAETIYGGLFEDQVVALGGADTVHALAGDDVVYAGSGADTVFGGLGDDSLFGGTDADLLNTGTGNDAAYGEAGNDTLIGELGDGLLFGGDGDDLLNGSAGQDALYGGFGNDVMFGENGDDAFFGDVGDDTAFGGAGDDLIDGGSGGDSLLGEAGDDLIDGGSGGDVLNGGAGVDNLIGGADGDVLIGGADGDRIEGGTGGDTIWYQAQSEGNDLIMGFNPAEDQLRFTGAAFGGFTAGSTLTNGSTFVSGTGPTSALPTFYYNSGSLFFDPDGTGAAGAVFIALFQGAPVLTAADFSFV